VVGPSRRVPHFLTDSQTPSCLCHLTLSQLCEQHIIYREFPTHGADDILFEHGPHFVVRQRYLANIAIEFLPALRAFKIDGHDVILPFLDCQRLAAQRGPEAASAGVICPASNQPPVFRTDAFETE